MTEQHPMFAGARTITPYGGASAPGGSTASREADADQITSGRLGALFVTAVARLRNAGPMGLTWGELGELESLHHGRATSLLSNMHRMGVAVRLAEKRPGTRSSIYVLPEFTNGRRVAEYKGSKASAALRENEELEQKLAWFTNKSAVDDDEKAKLNSHIAALTREIEDMKAENARLDELQNERKNGLLEKISNLTADFHGYKDLYEQAARNQAALAEEAYEADQTLGKALGYPEAFPEVSDVDDGSVVTGEHTLPSIAAEAAKKIKSLRETLETEREAAKSARPVVPTLSAEEAAFVDKIAGAVKSKRDDAVQPAKAGTLKALAALADRMPRA